MPVATSAQTPRSRAFLWRAPTGCPSESAVRAKLEELARGKGRRAERKLAGRALVERTPDGYRLTLTIEEDGGVTERRIDGASCAVLADAAAVIVAYAVDPTLMLGAPAKPDEDRNGRKLTASEPSRAPEPVAPAAPALVVEAPAPATPSVAPIHAANEPTVLAPPEKEIFASLGGGVGVGPLPDPVPIATVAFGVRYGAHRVALEGRYWARSEATSSLDPQATGSIGLAAATLTYGGLFGVGGGVRLGPVGGVEVGAIYGSGSGDIVTRSATGAWVAANVALVTDFPISPRSTFHTAVTGFAPFTRPTFVIDAADTVHRPASLGARLEGALEVAF